ncbi:hypothetical protein M0638_15525 [Roseomonas sp. NAR14]|uniref:Uncharacterized protein n=1 Tax=Roseomonas acroporae TaxID=2937791 RepID=A0A9X2BXB9_9PROT|nr:hypothetical protein [Roseomonas acroporae]MCK8785789.1 hypothetical protein [Roseomonas acroporae]
MYVDWNDWPPPYREPPPPPPRPRFTKRDERLVVWVLGVNLLLWFLAPLAGVTFLHAILAVLRG